jgi:hypothetical protein
MLTATVVNSKKISRIDSPFLTRMEEWTMEYLIDRLKQELATAELKNSKINTDLLDIDNSKFKSYYCLISSRKYINQAFHYLKIGVSRPVPEFVVSLSDFSSKLIAKVALLDRQTRKFVIKQAVGRIFEDINSELYHNSISRVLKVRLID